MRAFDAGIRAALTKIAQSLNRADAALLEQRIAHAQKRLQQNLTMKTGPSVLPSDPAQLKRISARMRRAEARLPAAKSKWMNLLQQRPNAPQVPSKIPWAYRHIGKKAR